MSSDAVSKQRVSSIDTVAEPSTSQRSRLCTLQGVQILGTGAYVPDEVVSNEDLSELGYDSDWIVQRTGIQERRRLPADLATSDMAFHAATRCLRDAGVDESQIDLVIVGTMTPDRPVPSTACLLQQKMELRAAAMDLNAACAGFLYSLATAAQFVKTRTVRYALVVGADTNTRVVNPADPKTYPLFGDGAGAVLLGPGAADQGLLSYTLGSEGSGADLLRIQGGGSQCPLTAEAIEQGKQYIQMDGRSVFKWAVRVLVDAIRDVSVHAQVGLDEIGLFILHQANLRIIEAAASDLGIDRDRLLINLDRYGNTSAASVPVAIDEAIRSNRIQRGDKILLCGFGAGLAWGAAIVQW